MNLLLLKYLVRALESMQHFVKAFTDALYRILNTKIERLSYDGVALVTVSVMTLLALATSLT